MAGLNLHDGPNSVSAADLMAVLGDDLTAKFGRVAPVPRAAGAIVFTWDDGTPNWLAIAQEASARGQRHTFCVTSDRVTGQNASIPDPLPVADLLAIHAMGHEIAAHSKTHAKHPTLTPAQRAVEYDYVKTFLENLIGEPVTTYVYPYGTTGAGRDATCDKEVWGRYDRVLDTNNTGVTHVDDRRGAFLIPRRAWTNLASQHDEVLSTIRQAASQPIIFSTYSHNPDGIVGGQPDITWAQMLEAMNLARDLGIPCITAREAYPAGGMLANANFESGTFGGWRQLGTVGESAVVPMVNPPTGFKAGNLVRVTSAGTADAGVRQLIPVTPGKTYTFSCRVRLGADGVGDTITAGGQVYIRFGKATDYAGTVSGWDNNAAPITSAAGDRSGAWQAMTVTQTIAAGVRFVEPTATVRGEAGITAEFAHFWFGESKQGDFG